MGVCCAHGNTGKVEVNIDLLNEEERFIAEQRQKAYDAKMMENQLKA